MKDVCVKVRKFYSYYPEFCAKFQWFVGRDVLIWKIFSSCFIFSVMTFPDEDPDFNVLFSNLHRNKLLVKQATCIQTYFS